MSIDLFIIIKGIMTFNIFVYIRNRDDLIRLMYLCVLKVI